MIEMSAQRRSGRPVRTHRWRCGLTAGLSVGASAAIWSMDTGAAGTRGLGDPRPVLGDGLVDLVADGARIAAGLLLAYLALASTANLVSSFELPRRRAPRLMRWFDRVAPRWLVMASVGIVATSTLSTSAGAAEPPPPHDDVVMEVVEDDRTSADLATSDAPGTGLRRSPRTMLPWADIIGGSATTLPPPPRLEPVGGGSTPTDIGSGDEPPTTLPRPGPDQLPPPAHVERPLPAAPGRLHTVQPGEHFWAIAEQTIADDGLDIGVTEYWQRLIDLNRAGLVDPDNPDMIFPGQVLVLP